MTSAVRSAFGRLHRLVETGEGALGDGRAIALAPFDELQGLARQRIGPALLGGQWEDITRGLLQHLARDREPLQDRSGARRRRPTRTGYRHVRAAVPGPAQQQRDVTRMLRGWRRRWASTPSLDRLALFVAQHGLESPAIPFGLDQGLADHVGDRPAAGYQPAMPMLARRMQSIRVGVAERGTIPRSGRARHG